MKILAVLLILAASLQPYIVWANSDPAAAAAAAAAASTAGRGGTASGSAAAAATAAAASTSRGGNTAVATAVATATSISAPSAHISCNCERVYKPVCGCDGRTYSNDCILRCISAHKVQNRFEPICFLRPGACPDKPCNCPAGGKPVCGSDGQVYGNNCYFDCENKRRELLYLRPIVVANPSVCRLPTCICPKEVIPVCGTDGRTYRNTCILQCVSRHNHANCKPGIRVKCAGVCEKENCICLLNIDPLCCSDGKTYNNLCHLQCENRKRFQLDKRPLTVQYKGQCVNCRCPKIYDPVCASNGQTFANICTLDCENRRRKANKKPLLTVDRHCVCPCKCNLEYSPVCGTDRKTYINKCKLECENKRRFDLGIALIGIANHGRCECRCGHCHRRYEPVCGSDGRSYWNTCWFSCSRSCSNKIGHLPFILQKGPC